MAQVFSCAFCEISKNTFFAEHIWAIVSVWISLLYSNMKRKQGLIKIASTNRAKEHFKDLRLIQLDKFQATNTNLRNILSSNLQKWRTGIWRLKMLKPGKNFDIRFA